MKKITLLFGLFLFVGASVFAQDYKYIGAKKCKMCHNKLAKGEQFKKWSEAPHSKAFATLQSDKAKEIAKEKALQMRQKMLHA